MTENLIRQRQAIQHLLASRSPADALVSYYALHHPPERTTVLTHRDLGGRVDGFLALCRTGMDLFRPLLTLKVQSREAAPALLQEALPPEAAVIIAVPSELRSIVEAFFTVSGESTAQIYRLERQDFKPVINVLVTRAPTPGGDPRFVIRGQSFDRGARAAGPALATAGVNWRSPDFADIYVHTDPQARGRGLGKSVVSSLSAWLLDQNVTPLFSAPAEHAHSTRLAQCLGFLPTGASTFFCDGIKNASFPLHRNVVD